MKVNRLGLKSMILAIVFVLVVSLGAASADAISKQQRVVVYKTDFHFVVDGQVYQTPVETNAFLYQGRTYVPVRFASYMLEKWVDWNGLTATVSVTLPSETQLKQLQNYKKQYLVPNADKNKAASELKKEAIYAFVDAAGYNFFGKEQPIPKDVTTFLHKGTVYVPLRYFTELIKHDIKYDASTRSVIMNVKSAGTDKDQPSNPTTPDNGQGGETVPGAEPGIPGTIPDTTPGTPGNGGEVTNPTRDELIAGVEAQLSRMKNTLTSRVLGLYNSYSKATNAEDKAKYIEQGLTLLGQADAQVSGIIDKLNSDLEKYGYEIGSEGADFLSQYEDEKAALAAKLS